jgi:hypothetical protein
MSADTVPVQEHEVEEQEAQAPVSPIGSEDVGKEAQDTEKAAPKEEHVPLSALQKERRKRQDVEQELRWHKEQMTRQQAPPTPQEPDESLQEPATREDLGKFKREVKREVFETAWIKDNPEKVADINDKLSEFLKQRPHLARAIEDAPNRYEEAWELMDKLTPKQKSALKPAPPKREAPGNPTGMPKAASLNETLDLGKMTDSEFNAWRQSKRQRR